MTTSPRPIDGAIVGTVGQVVPVGTIFLADWVPNAPTVPPATSLAVAGGLMNDPATEWVRQGLLRDDFIDIQETDSTKLEYRRGAKRTYYGEVTRQSGVRSVMASIDEVEDAVVHRLTKDPIYPIASPSAGNFMDMGTSEQFHRSLLAVYFDFLSGQEFHLYNPHVIVQYKMSKQDVFQELDIAIKLIPFVNANNARKDLRKYEFTTIVT